MTSDELDRALRIAPPHDLAPGFAQRTTRRILPSNVAHPFEWAVVVGLGLYAATTLAGSFPRLVEALPSGSLTAFSAFLGMLAVDRVLVGMSLLKKCCPRSATMKCGGRSGLDH